MSSPMASMGFQFLSVVIIFPLLISIIPILILYGFWKVNTNGNVIPWNWPFLGMLPTCILHIHRAHDRCTEILEQTGSSFLFKGLWFSKTDFLLTSDPANIHHIMTTHFEKFGKGPDFKYIFDILGDGFFSADSDSWKKQRKTIQSLVNHKGFCDFMEKFTKKKVEQDLVSVFNSFSKNGLVVDLQDLFQRLAFDCACIMVTGFDFKSLSTQFPQISFSKAMDEAQEVIFIRHVYPKFLWEFEKKLEIGQAKKLKKAWDTIDHIIAELIAMKLQSLHQQQPEPLHDEGNFDLITPYLKDNEYDNKFLRDTFINLMIAGRDAFSICLSWFFFSLSKNPTVVKKIREEIESIIPTNENQNSEIIKTFSGEEVSKLVYLHGAICETLRLYPPVPFEHKAALEDDVLPSGHRVSPNTKILFSVYAMGRMTSVWGKDCMEFKPERWITYDGRIKHVPSFKFFSFNAGPRSCVGKGVALTQLKMVAAAIVHNYNIQQIGKSDDVVPRPSMMLLMKKGFKVKITSRWGNGI